MKKIFYGLNALLIITLCGFSAHAGPKKLPLLDRMVASVNQDAITESELNKQTQLLLIRMRQSDAQLPPMDVLRQQILEKMVLEKLQLQLAEEDGIKIEEEVLNKTIADIASRDGLTLTQLQQYLEEQGIPYNQFRENIKTELTISKLQQSMVGPHINIGKTEIEHFLNSPAGQDQSGTEYRLGHILITLPESPTPEQLQSKQQRAESIVQELKAGGNFAQIAMAKSAGQQALSGGDLGWRKMAEIPTLFAKIVPSLQPGEIYGPIQDEGGLHILKLTNKRLVGEQQTSPVAMRNKAMEILYQRKFDEQLITWLRRLREDAQVKISLNDN